jgi:hypothetical protein
VELSSGEFFLRDIQQFEVEGVFKGDCIYQCLQRGVIEKNYVWVYLYKYPEGNQEDTLSHRKSSSLQGRVEVPERTGNEHGGYHQADPALPPGNQLEER